MYLFCRSQSPFPFIMQTRSSSPSFNHVVIAYVTWFDIKRHSALLSKIHFSHKHLMKSVSQFRRLWEQIQRQPNKMLICNEFPFMYRLRRQYDWNKNLYTFLHPNCLTQISNIMYYMLSLSYQYAVYVGCITHFSFICNFGSKIQMLLNLCGMCVIHRWILFK